MYDYENGFEAGKEAFRTKMIEDYKQEIANCWIFGSMHSERGEKELAEMWMHTRNAYEGILTSLQNPNYYKF